MAFVNVLFIKDLGGYVLNTASLPTPSVSMQDAYDGGPNITMTAALGGMTVGAPVAPDPPLAGPMMTLDSAQDAYPLFLVHQGTDATTPALNIFVNSLVSVGCPAIAVLQAFDADILRVSDANVSTDQQFLLTPVSMTFPSDFAAGFERGVVQTGSEGTEAISAATMVLRGGQGTDSLTAGPVSVGHATGAATEDGGFLLDPATGRMQLRAHSLGAETFGVLGLVDNSSTSEGTGTPADGDLSYRSEVEIAGNLREHGFRAYRADNFRLVARGTQQAFVNADLNTGTLTVNHGLDTPAPIIQVYDDNGNQIIPAVGGVTISTDNVGGNTSEIAFDASLLPLAGTWYVTVIGF